MAVSQFRRKSVSGKVHLQVHKGEPAKKTTVMAFDIGEDHYGVDLNEALDTIRDLLMAQSHNSRSMTGRFIRENRRKTIVFNLAECLAIMGVGKTIQKNTSFLLLDEQIADSRVGILVPGIHSIRHREYTEKRVGKDLRISPTPRINRRPLERREGKVRITTPLIDMRELVYSCTNNLKQEYLPQTSNGE